jgi:prepilin-type N-terminal cleavage/methylation domain-containing protein
VTRLRQLGSDESGFTLPELITAMGLGVVVLLAAALLLDSAVSGSNEIADRQDAVQRGRLAMEVVTRDLRSEVCLKDARPIVYGDANRVTFYSNLSSNPDAVDKRTLRYVPAEKRLWEDIHRGGGTFPDIVFPAGPTETREILGAVVPVKDGTVTRPIFRFYSYRVGGAAGELQALNVPLSAADAARVVMIKVAFAALPTRTATATTDRDATSLESDVYVRLADPTKPAEGLRCL